ncbi:MAG: PAS domain S-box protein [Syntrophales bacterium]|nr:PAS domain S-box protein [Syntrophales bacterium]
MEKVFQDIHPLARILAAESINGIFLVSKGEFIFVNANIARYTQYSVEELIGAKSDSMIHPDDRERVKMEARRMLRGENKVPYVYRIVTKQGFVRWVMETVSPITIDGNRLLLGNTMDVTDRMEAEERLRTSEDLYRTVFETTGTAMLIMEEDTTVSLVNTEFEKLSGAGKDYWEGKRSWREFVDKKDVRRMLRYHRDRRDDPSSAPRNYEFHFLDRQGNSRQVIMLASMIPGTKRSVAALVDITDRIEAERKLKTSENLYRAIFETTGTAMTIVEEDMTVSLVNTEFEKLSGAGRDFWEEKRSWKEYVYDDDLNKMLRYHQNRRIDPNSAPRNYEFRMVDRQGNVHNVLNTISVIPGTKRSVSSYIDITERIKSEEALIKREAELRDKTRDLEELNAALGVLLKKREEDRLDLENNVISGLNKLVMPCVEKLKRSSLKESDMTCLNIIESHLRDITSSFVRKLSSDHLKLSPRELQMAGLIKEGKTTKEIAEFMNVSLATVETHRQHIRDKLDLKGKKTNLRTFLASLT